MSIRPATCPEPTAEGVMAWYEDVDRRLLELSTPGYSCIGGIYRVTDSGDYVDAADFCELLSDPGLGDLYVALSNDCPDAGGLGATPVGEYAARLASGDWDWVSDRAARSVDEDGPVFYTEAFASDFVPDDYGRLSASEILEVRDGALERAMRAGWTLGTLLGTEPTPDLLSDGGATLRGVLSWRASAGGELRSDTGEVLAEMGIDPLAHPVGTGEASRRAEALAWLEVAGWAPRALVGAEAVGEVTPSMAQALMAETDVPWGAGGCALVVDGYPQGRSLVDRSAIPDMARSVSASQARSETAARMGRHL